MQAEAKKRLVIELDQQEHRAIKAKALLLGISMKEYVLRKLRGQEDDLASEDLTAALADALNEVKSYKEGRTKEQPETARAFFDKL